MMPVTCQQTNVLRLVPFDNRFAGAVSRWVTDREQLRLLAPSSSFPLSSERVCCWVKPGGRAFSLFDVTGGQPTIDPTNVRPLGYGELNPMRGHANHWWIGHVVIDPMRRGEGHGLALTNLLIDEAFNRCDATRISLVVFPENVAAARCYQKAGFNLIGEEHHRFGDSAQRHRLHRFELLRTDPLVTAVPRP